MLVMFLAFIVAILAIPCAMAPTMVWNAFAAGDEFGDSESYLDGKFVASRNPFRENAPPACMAKLIMLRHKINQKGPKRQQIQLAPMLYAKPIGLIPRTHPRPLSVPVRSRITLPWLKNGKAYR